MTQKKMPVQGENLDRPMGKEISQDSNKPIECQLNFTLWQDLKGYEKTEKSQSWPAFVESLKKVRPVTVKTDALLIKFAKFGDKGQGGCLRTDGNVVEVTGIELDIDSGVLTFEQALTSLEGRNVKAVVVTTFTHTPEAPRLRVFCPLSQAVKPNQRSKFVARLNGILDGNVGPESFTLSQSYFIGGQVGKPYHVRATFNDPEAGEYIDLIPGLPEVYPLNGKSDPDDFMDKPRLNRKSDPIISALVEEGLYIAHVGAGKHHIICPWADEHSADTGPGQTAYFEPHTGGFKGSGFKCLHSHCSGRGIKELRAFLGLDKINIDEQAIIQRAKEILDSQHPCGPFELDKLPPVIADYARELCDQTAAEPAMIVQSILCTVSSCIGKKLYLPETEYFQKLYSNLWFCTVSKSGSFKTTALNKGSSLAFKILAELQKKIDELQRVLLTAPKEAQGDLTKQIAGLERQKPILSSRATAEALTDELACGQAGQIISSELGGWLKNMNASHAGAVKQLITDFYDCPPFYSYRTRSQGTLTVREPFITINGVSTLEWIQQNIQSDDVTSGFFPRFLLFYPPQKKVIPSALPMGRKSDRLKPTRDKLMAILEGHRNEAFPVEYTLSSEARELFNVYHISLYDTLFKESEKAQQILEPFVKRWSPYILKIAMLMQAVDKPGDVELKPEALVAAKYVVDYAIKSTTYLFQHELGETEHQRKCRKVLEYMANRKGQCTWGQMLSSHALKGGTKDYEYVCQTLEESGQIDIDTTPGKKQNHTFTLKAGV